MKKLLMLAAALVCFASEFKLSGAEPEAPLRFLFLVDTSRSMSRLNKVTPQIAHDLIATGFVGRIKRGERFGIWTFNEQVLTNRFPVREWTEENIQPLAQEASRFLSKQRFSKTTRMETALAEMKKAIAGIPQITIVILTDGDDKFVGTPFDRSINGILAEFGKKLRRAKEPFVIVLQGENGALTGWRAHTGGGAISFPDMPDPLREASSVLTERFITNIVVIPRTNSLAGAVTEPAVSENPKPEAAEVPKALASAIPSPLPSAPPPAIQPAENKPEAVSITPAPAPVAKAEVPPVEIASASREAKPSTPMETPPGEVTGEKTIATAPQIPEPEAKPPQPMPIGLLALAGSGVGFLLVCGIAYSVFTRKKNAPSSMISRSLDGNGK